MKVIVIGCGPAGLAAAHAAVGLGAEVEIIAPKAMTPQNGPLLLQRPIPGVNLGHPDGTIHQIVIGGTILDYRYKLYGDINIGINGDVLKKMYHAWKHRETYCRLWDMYQDRITDRKVGWRELRRLHESVDLVISTANAHSLCFQGHSFVSKSVVITPTCSWPDQRDNTIIFNAAEEVPWVRSSKVFGHEVTEWPLSADRPDDSRVILKPISTNCSCYPHVLRTGRFGKFHNETWVDTAYWDAYEAIINMLEGSEIERIGKGEFTTTTEV